MELYQRSDNNGDKTLTPRHIERFTKSSQRVSVRRSNEENI